MSHTHQILVVAPDVTLARRLRTWLNDACDELVIVHAFAAAKVHLSAGPDLLITEVKLGDYNGMQLALQAGFAGIPSIVLGRPDRVSEREASNLGATYLSLTRLQCGQLLSKIAALVQGVRDGHPATTFS